MTETPELLAIQEKLKRQDQVNLAILQLLIKIERKTKGDTQCPICGGFLGLFGQHTYVHLEGCEILKAIEALHEVYPVLLPGRANDTCAQ